MERDGTTVEEMHGSIPSTDIDVFWGLGVLNDRQQVLHEVVGASGGADGEAFVGGVDVVHLGAD